MLPTMKLFLCFFSIIYAFNFLAFSSVPLCDLYADTYGKWIHRHFIDNHTISLHQIQQHLIGESNMEFLNFSEIWIPSNCSYHRFTNLTIHQCVNNMNIHKKPMVWYFLGDSGFRGIVCGITRILSGSELYGPCINPVCGGADYGPPISYKNYGEHIELSFGPNLKIVFIYVKSIYYKHLDWAIEHIITKNMPYALVFNTGAWDFDKIARNHQNQTASEVCDTEETRQVSLQRSSPSVNKTIWELSDVANQFHVRLIYRNNHHNKRFGTLCADEAFEKLLVGSHWEVWDNRRISEKVWEEQCWDGYHFDRHRVNTYAHHVSHMNYFKERNWILPGSMEMQLAQSLLNSLLRDCVKTILSNQSHPSSSTSPTDPTDPMDPAKVLLSPKTPAKLLS